MAHKQLLIWEISGIVFLIVFGSILHFTFEWSKGSTIVGIISAVNESVWEHLKLGFWSLVVYSLLEYLFVKEHTNNFLLAKALGLLILQSSILLVFYTYTMFTGKPILLVDISSYVLGTVLCQLVSYQIMTRTLPKIGLNWLGAGLILAHGVLLVVFTFNPPHQPIFQDSHTKTYGIEKNRS